MYYGEKELEMIVEIFDKERYYYDEKEVSYSNRFVKLFIWKKSSKKTESR
jgi:hypothetical protein